MIWARTIQASYVALVLVLPTTTSVASARTAAETICKRATQVNAYEQKKSRAPAPKQEQVGRRIGDESK